MNDRREDDEAPVSIEADVPEADWIEQHQPVLGESDDDLFPRELPEDVAEADALEQARSVPDDDFDVEVEPPTELPTQFVQGTSHDEPDPLELSRENPRGRGCNLIAVIADVLMRSARDAVAQISRTTAPPPR